MFKKITTIYDVIDILYYPTKFFGMAPYTRKMGTDGRYTYSVLQFGLQHMLVNGAVSIYLIITSVCRILSETTTLETISFIQCIDGAIFIFFQLMGLVTMLIFILKQDLFLGILKKLDRVDQLFRKFNIPVSYYFMQASLYLFLIVLPIYMFTIAAPLWELIELLQKEEFYQYKPRNHILLVLNVTPLFVIRHAPVYFYTGVIAVIYNRFEKLNVYLTELERSNRTNKQSVKDALELMEEIHNLLYEIAKHMDKTFSLPIFFNISITFLELIASVVILEYSVDLGPSQILSGISFFVLIAAFILIVCERTKTMARESKRVLCELTLPYFDTELSKKRKVIMLQMLHEKIEFDAYGFYPLDMTVITDHVGTISTLLMFLLQLRDVLVV